MVKQNLFLITIFLFIASCREDNPRLESGNKENLSISIKKEFLTCEFTHRDKRNFKKDRIITWDDIKELDEYKMPIIGSDCTDLEGVENQSICVKKFKINTINKIALDEGNNCEKLKSEVKFQVGFGTLDDLKEEKTIELEQSIDAVIPSQIINNAGEKVSNIDSFEIPLPNIIYFDGLVKPGFEFKVKDSNFMEIKSNEDLLAVNQVRFLINLKKTTIGFKNCLGLNGSKNNDLSCERNKSFDNLTSPNEGRGQIYLNLMDKNGFLSKNEIIVNVPLNEKVIGWFNGGKNNCKKSFKAKDDCLLENMMPNPYNPYNPYDIKNSTPDYFYPNKLKDKTKEEVNKLLECNRYNQKLLKGADYGSESDDCPVVFKENGDVYGLINLAEKDFSFRSTPFMGMSNCSNGNDKGHNCFVQFMNDKRNKFLYEPHIHEQLFYLMDKKFNSTSENLNPFLANQYYVFSPNFSVNQLFDAFVDGSLCSWLRDFGYHSSCFSTYFSDSNQINNSGLRGKNLYQKDEITFSPTYFYVNERERFFELLDNDFDTSIFIVYDGRFIESYFKSINSSNPVDQIFPILLDSIDWWDNPLSIHCSAREKICAIRGQTEENNCHTNSETKTRYCPGSFPVSNFKITEENKCKGCPIIIQVDFKFQRNGLPVSRWFMWKNSSDLPEGKTSEEILINTKIRQIKKVYKINKEKIKFYSYEDSLPSNEKIFNEEVPKKLYYPPLDLKDYLSKETKEPAKLSKPILRGFQQKIGSGYFSKNSPTLNILDIRVYKDLSEENKENIYKNLMESYK